MKVKRNFAHIFCTPSATGLLLLSSTSPFSQCADCVNFLCVIVWPWPFDLEQLSYMAGHVHNPATKFEDPTTICSWVTSYNVSHWLALKMCTRPLRMRRITWPVSRGSKKPPNSVNAHQIWTVKSYTGSPNNQQYTVEMLHKSRQKCYSFPHWHFVRLLYLIFFINITVNLRRSIDVQFKMQTTLSC